MKTMTFKYRPNNRSKMRESMKKAIAGEPQVFEDVIFFESLDLVDSFINPMKAKIIRSIQKHSPESIYELAKILGKDQGYIQKEVKFLEGLGILKIESIKDSGRTKSVPTVIYDKFIIDLDDSDQNSMAV